MESAASRWPFRACLAAVCLLAATLPAAAQKESVLSVGVAASVYRPDDAAVSNPWGIGLVMRLRRTSGFGATLGLNWFKADVGREIDGESVKLGRLLVRPVMGGVSYTRQYSRFALVGSFVVGYAFNGLRNTGAATDAYASRLGQPGASFTVSDCIVYRPGFAVWWDLGSRFGLLTSVSYIALRPEVVTTVPSLGTFRRSVNMSSPLFTVGIGYAIF